MDKKRSMTSFLLLDSVHRSMAVFISVIFLSAPVSAALGRNAIKMAQMPAATSSEENRVAAERAFAEAEQLFKQGTAESRQQAIAKYEEALKRWQTVGDRSQEAKTLASLGLVYYSLGEKQKTLDLYNQSLSLRRALSPNNYGH